MQPKTWALQFGNALWAVNYHEIDRQNVDICPQLNAFKAQNKVKLASEFICSGFKTVAMNTFKSALTEKRKTLSKNY